jgi:hypothetical protein
VWVHEKPAENTPFVLPSTARLDWPPCAVEL